MRNQTKLRFRTASSRSKIKNFGLSVVGLTALLLLWVHQSVRSTQISYQIQKLEGQIKEEQSHRSVLEMERDRYLSLDYVEQVAKSKLGMAFPKKEDILIVSVKQ